MLAVLVFHRLGTVCCIEKSWWILNTKKWILRKKLCFTVTELIMNLWDSNLLIGVKMYLSGKVTVKQSRNYWFVELKIVCYTTYESLIIPTRTQKSRAGLKFWVDLTVVFLQCMSSFILLVPLNNQTHFPLCFSHHEVWYRCRETHICGMF